MKFFITLLSTLLLVFGAQSTKAQTSAKNLNPFKKDGVGNKVAIERFQSAVQNAINGNESEWNSLIRVSFDDYCVLVKNNVTSGYKTVTVGEAEYMLLHSKLVTRHIQTSEKIWGVTASGALDYYTIDHDFDGAVLVYEYADNRGNLIQVELCLWECFNPKQVRYQIAPPTTTAVETVYVDRIVYRDREVIREPQVVYQQPTTYYTRSGFDWTVLLSLPVWTPGYYCIPMNRCQSIFGYLPQYRCNYQGQQCGLYPVNQQTTTIVNNYVTVNVNNTNNTVINVINPPTQTPRPTPTYVNTGGGGVTATNTGGGGINGTNTGGGGFTYDNTGGYGKRDWDNVPYQTPRQTNVPAYASASARTGTNTTNLRTRTYDNYGNGNVGNVNVNQPTQTQRPVTTTQSNPQNYSNVGTPRTYNTTPQQQPIKYQGQVQQRPMQNVQTAPIVQRMPQTQIQPMQMQPRGMTTTTNFSGGMRPRGR